MGRVASALEQIGDMCFHVDAHIVQLGLRLAHACLDATLQVGMGRAQVEQRERRVRNHRPCVLQQSDDAHFRVRIRQ
ncbi:hypothetical protein [Caballeronia grimmiae]|uniref:hypothetical protein n=1 Tax=Caballeronia grimmiae TaxID=1071679 RepID=UPI0038B6F68C